MADLTHPTTGEHIALGPDEQLHRICWHGAPVLVVTALAPAVSCSTGWHGPAAKCGTPSMGCRWSYGPK